MVQMKMIRIAGGLKIQNKFRIEMKKNLQYHTQIYEISTGVKAQVCFLMGFMGTGYFPFSFSRFSLAKEMVESISRAIS